MTELTCAPTCEVAKSKGRALLTIPYSSKEDLGKIFAIEDALNAIGVHFDTGAGGCGRDWYLDYSMKGATIIAHSEGE